MNQTSSTRNIALATTNLLVLTHLMHEMSMWIVATFIGDTKTEVRNNLHRECKKFYLQFPIWYTSQI